VIVDPKSYYAKTIDSDILLQAASSRLATTAYIEVTQGKILNVQSIKALTGNDMSDGGVRVNVTVVSTMNKLYYPLDIKDQARERHYQTCCGGAY
jgi:hypothetical protein